MSLFVVDQEKCKRDGICATECPVSILTMNDHDPEPVEGAEQRCLNCGHCVAVCPHGAISLQTMPSERCQPLRDDWRLTPEQVEQFLKGRRSIRTYKDQPVEREVLTHMIDMARFAPSGHNGQPVSWLVIHDKNEVKRLAGVVIDWMRSQVEAKTPFARAFSMKGLVAAWETGYDPICRSAPHLIITHAPKNNKIASLSCSIALTYLELAALPFGLGTCWAGYFQLAAEMSSSLQEALALPDGHQSFGAMMVGYPKFEYQRIPMRNEAQIMWR